MKLFVPLSFSNKSSLLFVVVFVCCRRCRAQLFMCAQTVEDQGFAGN